MKDRLKDRYFVVRRELEDITDDFAMDVTCVNEVGIGDEQYILNSAEKSMGYTLGASLHDISEKGTVVVILGRIVTAEEIDLKSEDVGR